MCVFWLCLHPPVAAGWLVGFCQWTQLPMVTASVTLSDGNLPATRILWGKFIYKAWSSLAFQIRMYLCMPLGKLDLQYEHF